MATITNDVVDIRGCPAAIRFTVPADDTWVGILLAYAIDSGATRVAITVSGGGKVAHAATPGSAVGASDDYQLLPDGLAYYFDLEPGRPINLQVATDSDSSDVHIHVTSSPTCASCSR